MLHLFNISLLFLNRLFGIKSVIQTDCSSTWKIIANPDLSWYHHANPIVLLVMYYTLATLIRIWLQEPVVRTRSFHGLVCKVAGDSGERVRSYQLLNIVYPEITIVFLSECFVSTQSPKQVQILSDQRPASLC